MFPRYVGFLVKDRTTGGVDFLDLYVVLRREEGDSPRMWRYGSVVVTDNLVAVNDEIESLKGLFLRANEIILNSYNRPFVVRQEISYK